MVPGVSRQGTGFVYPGRRNVAQSAHRFQERAELGVAQVERRRSDSELQRTPLKFLSSSSARWTGARRCTSSLFADVFCVHFPPPRAAPHDFTCFFHPPPRPPSFPAVFGPSPCNPLLPPPPLPVLAPLPPTSTACALLFHSLSRLPSFARCMIQFIFAGQVRCQATMVESDRSFLMPSAKYTPASSQAQRARLDSTASSTSPSSGGGAGCCCVSQSRRPEWSSRLTSVGCSVQWEQTRRNKNHAAV